MSNLVPNLCISNHPSNAGQIFYDIAGERYVDEDEEKIVLMPQARDRELAYQLLACLAHLASVGAADALRLDGGHTAHPRTCQGRGSVTCLFSHLCAAYPFTAWQVFRGHF